MTSKLPWHTMSGEVLMELLWKAHNGQHPDMVYMEEYANAEHEQVPPNDDD